MNPCSRAVHVLGIGNRKSGTRSRERLIANIPTESPRNDSTHRDGGEARRPENRSSESIVAKHGPTDSTEEPERIPPLLIGQLRWHESCNRDDFRITYKRLQREPSPLYLAENGEFKLFRKAPVGIVDVIVHFVDDEIPLKTVPDLNTNAGPIVGGTLIIDATEVQRLDLEFVDANGSPIGSRRQIRVLDPKGETAHHYVAHGPGGTASILMRWEGQRAQMWADGYEPRELELPCLERVQLQGQMRVRVELVFEVMPEFGVRPEPRLAPQGGDWNAVQHIDAAAMRKFARSMRRPGEQRVRPDETTSIEAQMSGPPATVTQLHSARDRADRSSNTLSQTFAIAKPGKYAVWWTFWGGETDAERRIMDIPKLGYDRVVRIEISRAELETAKKRMRAVLEKLRRASHEKRRK